jgi:uncharacterized cupredoxin-like copper-binding protein
MRSGDLVRGAILMVGAAVGLTGCSSDETTGAGSTPGAVDVTVHEFEVVPETSSESSGDITFTVTNTGPDDVHEFVVVKTDLAPDALPTDSTGAVDEAGVGIEPVDEIEDIAVGATESVTVTLEAGSYVLMCNIYDKAEKEAHYQMGMRTAFSVT